VATRAQAVVTANPGCIMQIAMGLQRAGHAIPVLHIMDLLGWAYGDEEDVPAVVRRAMR
jgi:glycolate oxidase iron-sulfur subunit